MELRKTLPDIFEKNIDKVETVLRHCFNCKEIKNSEKLRKFESSSAFKCLDIF